MISWVLVGVLAVACGVLAGMLIMQSTQLAELRATPRQAASQEPGTTANAKPAAGIPQPVTDPEALKIARELPRRDQQDPLALGRPDAKVVLTVWSDFRCPFCSKWERETLPQLKPFIDSGSLRIEHRDLVLFGEESERAAIAARAAGRQGKFWEYAAAIAKVAPASGHPPMPESKVKEFAAEAGLDPAQFAADLADPALAKAVQDDTAHAKQIRISGTPFFIVNDTPINGAYPSEIFAKVIESYGGRT